GVGRILAAAVVPVAVAGGDDQLAPTVQVHAAAVVGPAHGDQPAGAGRADEDRPGVAEAGVEGTPVDELVQVGAPVAGRLHDGGAVGGGGVDGVVVVLPVLHGDVVALAGVAGAGRGVRRPRRVQLHQHHPTRPRGEGGVGDGARRALGGDALHARDGAVRDARHAEAVGLAHHLAQHRGAVVAPAEVRDLPAAGVEQGREVLVGGAPGALHIHDVHA